MTSGKLRNLSLFFSHLSFPSFPPAPRFSSLLLGVFLCGGDIQDMIRKYQRKKKETRLYKPDTTFLKVTVHGPSPGYGILQLLLLIPLFPLPSL